MTEHMQPISDLLESEEQGSSLTCFAFANSYSADANHAQYR